jgi:ribosome-binding protein aMBF1 (putative translation factor)
MAEPINTSSAVIARIRAWAAAKGWKKSRFAAEAGLPDTTLRDFDSDDWNPTRNTLERLEALIPKTWQPGEATPVSASTTANSKGHRAGAAAPALKRPGSRTAPRRTARAAIA